MTIAMITVSGRPFIFNSRNTGGNVSKLQCEATILAIISPGFMARFVQAQDIAVSQDPNRRLGGFSLREDQRAICEEQNCH